MNNIIFIAEIIFALTGALLTFRFLGKNGLIGYAVLAVICANIQVLKLFPALGVETVAGGAAMFGVTYWITDVLGECYGKALAKKVVWISSTMLVIFTIAMQICLAYTPAAGGDGFAQEPLSIIFGFMPKIAIASVALYFISNYVDVWLFDKVRQLTKGKYLWLRNNLCTLVCNVSQGVIFTVFVLYGTVSLKTCLTVGFVGSLMYVPVALLDTPFIYLAKKWFDSGKIKD